MSKILYNRLEVDKDATPETLKKSYRNLSKKYHPDINKDPDAEGRFKDIANAYEILSDPEKKANYDKYGSADAPQGMGGMSDMFGNDFFSQFFGGGSQRGQQFKRRGTDLRVTIQLSLKEIFTGVNKKIKINQKI